MPINSESELQKFLSSKSIDATEIKVLAEGSTNYCWRFTGRDDKRVIAKHAKPFIRTLPDIPIPIERLGYEQSALVEVPRIDIFGEDIRVPQLYDYFPEDHVLCMSNGGSQNLKEAYKKNNDIDIPLLGKRIGYWLARLHKQTSTPKKLAYVKNFDNKFGQSVFKYTYNGLDSILRQHGYDPALGERINTEFGTETDEDKICLCHGDFWPSNIQLEDQAPATQGGEEKETDLRAPELTIIDWENVHVGNGATDAARFAADSWLLDRFHGNRGMTNAFLKEYLNERPLDLPNRIRFAVHFAVHIIFYSRMKWTDEKGTKEIVRIGKDMLEAVEKEDEQSLYKGPLAQLFNEVREIR